MSLVKLMNKRMVVQLLMVMPFQSLRFDVQLAWKPVFLKLAPVIQRPVQLFGAVIKSSSLRESNPFTVAIAAVRCN